MGRYKGDTQRSYKEAVEYFHEGLPLGRSFATVDDQHWVQGELTAVRKVDKSGNISVPSDMDEVRNLK